MEKIPNCIPKTFLKSTAIFFLTFLLRMSPSLAFDKSKSSSLTSLIQSFQAKMKTLDLIQVLNLEPPKLEVNISLKIVGDFVW